jgi:hypothetical protein
MSVLSVYLACLCDWADDLSLGERGMALFMAPTERQAGVAHRYAEAVVDNVKVLSRLVRSRTVNSIALRRPIDIETQPANWRFSRGSTAISIALDECAFLYTADDAANSDTELMVALKPSLATTGGPMLLTSSPSNMEGIVYKLWKRHYGAQGDPRILVVQSDSRTLNPSLRQSVVDRAYEEDPTSAEAEYGGAFRQPVSAYLERSVIEKAIDKGITGRTIIPRVTYFAFVDVAGGTGSDSYCLAIGHNVMDGGRIIHVVDVLVEVRPPFNPDEVTAQAAELLRQWRISRVNGDSYAAGYSITAFARGGISYGSSPSASELYLHSLPLWTAGRVSMLDVPRAIDQLANLMRRQDGPREKVVHPKNAHDDLANTVAGLLWRLSPVDYNAGASYGGIGVFTQPRAYPGYAEDTRNPALAYGSEYRPNGPGNGSLVW